MKYAVYQFDRKTFVVFDIQEKREVCVCSNYSEVEDAELRARMIANALNSL